MPNPGSTAICIADQESRAAAVVARSTPVARVLLLRGDEEPEF